MNDLGFQEAFNTYGHSVKADFFNIRKPFFLYADVQEARGCFRNQKCSQWDKFGGTLVQTLNFFTRPV